MRQAVSTRRIARAMERARARAASMPTRSSRKRSRGQTVIIFALMFTTLLGFMGLAIDTARVYDLYARMERAAESGALAGVIYMPNNYLTNLTAAPNDNAVCRALQEVSKNGFGTYCNPASQPASLSSMPANCPLNSGSPSSVEVAVCPVQNQQFELQVYVTEPINVVFLSALGVGPLTITALATAQYLPPSETAVDPGAPGGTAGWGTFGECNGASAACLGSGVRNWSGNINGPGELKEQGDPLVSCQEGPTGPVNIDTPITKTAVLTTTYTGLPTNHPQSVASPDGCGNPDTANAFTGQLYTGAGSRRAGYTYFASVPAGDTENLWVWNAPFSPSSTSTCNGRTGGNNQASYDVFYYYNCQGSSSSSYPTYPHTACATAAAAPNNSPYTCTDPNLFFAVTYTIYKIDNTNTPDSAGTLLGSYTALPYEINDHSCPFWQPDATGGPFKGYPSGCVTPVMNCVAQWCPLFNGTGDPGLLPAAISLPGAAASAGNSGGTDYRIVVTVADFGDPTQIHAGYGGHSYSLKLCPASLGIVQSAVGTCATDSGAVVAGWGVTDALFVFPGNGGGGPQTTEYPLGFIPSSAAGKYTVDVQLFDEGDLQGTNNSLKGLTAYAVAPPVAGVADPCTVTTAQLTAAGYPASNFFFPYNERTALFSPALNAIVGSSSGDMLYNGLWVDEQISVPSTYAGGEWTLCATAPQTNDGDVLALKFSTLADSPVHLV